MNDKLHTKGVDTLFDAILTLQTRDDCYRFFEDICTVKELLGMSERLEVASMLKKQLTYQEIASTTGASTATISRVNRALTYGCDGYQLVFDRLDNDR